MADADILNV